MELRLVKLHPEQHFTQPPPRFNESSLVKEMEEQGIGRPSTYAAILETIQEKQYVEKVEKSFKPTQLGTLVTDELVRAFPREMDVAFTAGMEEKLDEIEDGNAAWRTVLQEFYGTFKEDLAKAKEKMRNVKRQEIETDLVCEKCGKRDGHQVGAQRRVPRLPRLPGVPEHDELPARGREDRPGEGGGGRGRGQVPGLRRGDGDEARPLRPVPRLHPLPRVQGHEARLHRRHLPEGVRRLHHREALAPGQDVLRLLLVPEVRLRLLGPPAQRAVPQCGSAYLLDKYSKKTGPFVACPNKECDYRREAPPSAEA